MKKSIVFKKSFRIAVLFAVISILVNAFAFFGVNKLDFWQYIDMVLNAFAYVSLGRAFGWEIIGASAVFWFVVGFVLGMMAITLKTSKFFDTSKTLDTYLAPDKNRKTKEQYEVKVCHSCGEEIHITAKKCPHCGAKQV